MRVANIAEFLTVLAGILAFGWIGIRSSPDDEVGLIIGRACLVGVLVLCGYALWALCESEE